MGKKEDVINDLLGKSTVKRRKAAIAVRKIGGDICSSLVQALELEITSKSWQTKCELAITLGLLGCKEAIPILRESVFDTSNEHDLFKLQSSKALIRLSKKESNAFDVVNEILSNCGYSAKEGALEALGYDKIVFENSECDLILQSCWDFGNDRLRGYTDPRYGLAAACAGWKCNMVAEFLKHCIATGDVPLKYVAENALEGCYVTLR